MWEFGTVFYSGEAKLAIGIGIVIAIAVGYRDRIFLPRQLKVDDRDR
jgi:hypothetical protein